MSNLTENTSNIMTTLREFDVPLEMTGVQVPVQVVQVNSHNWRSFILDLRNSSK